MRSSFVLAVAAAAAIVGSSAVADPVSVQFDYTTEEEIRFQFADKSGHFILAVRREGTAEGSGVFAGAAVTDLGWHDVNPPVSGAPQGYLQLTAQNGDTAVLRWTVTATFVKGAEGKPAFFNQGIWELVRGTGQFADKRGVGSIILKPAEKKVILEGEVGDKV